MQLVQLVVAITSVLFAPAWLVSILLWRRKGTQGRRGNTHALAHTHSERVVFGRLPPVLGPRSCRKSGHTCATWTSCNWGAPRQQSGTAQTKRKVHPQVCQGITKGLSPTHQEPPTPMCRHRRPVSPRPADARLWWFAAALACNRCIMDLFALPGLLLARGCWRAPLYRSRVRDAKPVSWALVRRYGNLAPSGVVITTWAALAVLGSVSPGRASALSCIKQTNKQTNKQTLVHDQNAAALMLHVTDTIG